MGVDLLADPVGIQRHIASGVLLEFQDKLDVIVIVARGDMKMKMENGLPCGLAVVRKNIETGRLEGIHERLRDDLRGLHRSEEHTSELQSHSFISYAVFCLT